MELHPNEKEIGDNTMKQYYKIIDGTVIQSVGVANTMMPFAETDTLKLLTLEEYDATLAQIQAEAEAEAKLVADYIAKVKAGTMTTADVPEKYRQQVIDATTEPATTTSDYDSGYQQALLDMATIGGATA